MCSFYCKDINSIFRTPPSTKIFNPSHVEILEWTLLSQYFKSVHLQLVGIYFEKGCLTGKQYKLWSDWSFLGKFMDPWSKFWSQRRSLLSTCQFRWELSCPTPPVVKFTVVVFHKNIHFFVKLLMGPKAKSILAPLLCCISIMYGLYRKMAIKCSF